MEGHNNRRLGVNLHRVLYNVLNKTTNPAPAPQELEFPFNMKECLTKEVAKIVKKQAISQVPKAYTAKGFLSQLFPGPKKEGAMRPIISLTRMNSIVQTVHFKMEGIHLLEETLKSGDWKTKVNLKDAYSILHDSNSIPQ